MRLLLCDNLFLFLYDTAKLRVTASPCLAFSSSAKLTAAAVRIFGTKDHNNNVPVVNSHLATRLVGGPLLWQRNPDNGRLTGFTALEAYLLLLPLTVLE